MKLLSRILGRIALVRVEFTPSGECVVGVSMWRRGEAVSVNPAAAKGCLAAAVVCGCGVVTKPDEAEVTARVKSDPETFLWSSANGCTSFVRRERIRAAEEELAARNIVPVRIFCAGCAADFGHAAGEFVRQVHAGLSWKALLKPAPASSAAAQVLVRRIGFPVLGLFLLLLTVNAVLSPRLYARRQSLESELAARERTASNAASAGARQRELLAEFTASPGVSRALLCDRVARAVPAGVVLTSLDVEPLSRRFEAGKPLQRREGVVLLGGTAPAAADISAFVQGLPDACCCRAVRLVHVEKERDGELLSFRIEIQL